MQTYRFLRLIAPAYEELTEGAEWPLGFVQIPEGTTAEWMKLLTAEHLMTIKTRKMFQRLEWLQTRERNEALDCRVYPVMLAEARTTTFTQWRKVFIASTPTHRGISQIEPEYEASDQRRFSDTARTVATCNGCSLKAYAGTKIGPAPA